jgi:NAD(P) transhydrogenase subunit beta
MSQLVSYIYLVAAVCFIQALKGLSSPVSARTGNVLGILGMFLAITATLMMPEVQHQWPILMIMSLGALIGVFLALNINMTVIPQLIAGFHSLVGLAALFVAISAFLYPSDFNIGRPGAIVYTSLIELSLGLIIGAITFSGSCVAFMKLQGLISAKPLRFSGRGLLNLLVLVMVLALLLTFILVQSQQIFILLGLFSLLLGLLLILPIGGADMPVVISMLNSYSGWAACGIGFTLNNSLLIITGALVGASGAILSYVMCKGMNRSFWQVLVGSGVHLEAQVEHGEVAEVNQANGEDAAFFLEQAKSVIIVPGYGMAVARAQHALKELVDKLRAKGVTVRFAIHPVAGRMPGHMNVLLAEANIPYNLVFEQQEINRDFMNCDVVLVVGANDVTNPAAKNNPSSPLFGMPVLDVGMAKRVFFIKRSLAPGYAGIENELFYQPNTYLLFGDAKAVLESIIKSLS